MKNNTAKFKNPLMSALFGMGMPVWTRDDGWIANDGKFGSFPFRINTRYIKGR
jgi:hypothetical protein